MTWRILVLVITLAAGLPAPVFAWPAAGGSVPDAMSQTNSHEHGQVHPGDMQNPCEQAAVQPCDDHRGCDADCSSGCSHHGQLAILPVIITPATPVSTLAQGNFWASAVFSPRLPDRPPQ